MRISASAPKSVMVEQEIFTSNALYLQMTVNGTSMAPYFGGRDWLEYSFSGPAKQLAGQPGQQGSAIALLHQLERKGARVVPKGTQNIGGLTCTEVSVTPAGQAAGGAQQGVTAQSLTFWFDPKRDLTCQLAISAQIALPSAAGGAPAATSTRMLMTFTHYGAPVTITPPPASETYTLTS
jgi:hypothetical protein